LLLSFVQQGLRTPYELKARAGISLGSTVPALARLEKDRLLKSSDRGTRGSRGFEITKAGAKLLQESWRTLLNDPVADADRVLRTAYLAWKYGSAAESARYLKSASASLSGMEKVASAEAERFGNSMTTVNAEAHRWLRARLEAAQLGARVHEFEALATHLKGKPDLSTKSSLKSRSSTRSK
jgi:DNA-binding PadR family transcriptional regulator